MVRILPSSAFLPPSSIAPGLLRTFLGKMNWNKLRFLYMFESWVMGWGSEEGWVCVYSKWLFLFLPPPPQHKIIIKWDMKNFHFPLLMKSFASVFQRKTNIKRLFWVWKPAWNQEGNESKCGVFFPASHAFDNAVVNGTTSSTQHALAFEWLRKELDY